MSGRAAARDRQVVGLQLLVARLHLDPGLLLGHLLDLGPEQHLDPILLELALDHSRHVLVLQRQDPVEHLDQGHLDSEAGVGRGDLRARRSGARHDQRLRQLLQRPGAPGVDHPVGELDAGDRHLHRAGCEHDRLRLVAVGADLDLAAPLERCLAGEEIDLVLLPEHLDAVVERLRDACAAALDRLPIDRQPARLDPEVGAVAVDVAVDLCRVQHRLRRDAGVVEAAPAGLVALDHGGLLAQLGGSNRRHVATGAASDHDHVVCRHTCFDSIGRGRVSGIWIRAIARIMK